MKNTVFLVPRDEYLAIKLDKFVLPLASLLFSSSSSSEPVSNGRPCMNNVTHNNSTYYYFSDISIDNDSNINIIMLLFYIV